MSGVINSCVLTSFLALIQFLIDADRLQAIVHWTMGNLHAASWPKIYSAGFLIFIAAVCQLMLGYRMNVLAMGDEVAKAVGIYPAREKLFILLPAVLAASASVAVAGIIGLMRLVVPHLVRIRYSTKYFLPSRATPLVSSLGKMEAPNQPC
jgi:iron complex transport system permease protein